MRRQDGTTAGRQVREVGLVLFLAVLASCRLAALQCPNGAPPPCTGGRALAPALVVVPFENLSRDSSDIYLAVTFTEDVTAALGASHAVRLLGVHGNRRAADYQLAGSVRRENGIERVSARLERTGSGEIVWTTTLDRSASAPSVVGLLARQVLQRLGARPSATVQPRAERTVDPVAFDLYRRGRYFGHRRTQADIVAGLDLLTQAVARDPSYALAWAEIATTLSYAYLWQTPIPSIRPESVLIRELDASTRALLADSTRSEIWSARATALADVEPTTRVGAIRAFRRALALDSLNAVAWSNLGYALMEAGETAAGRQAMRRSMDLDPVNPTALVYCGLLLYWNRQYDSAGVMAESALAVDPAYISAHRLAGTVALARGDYAVAEAQFGAASNIGPGVERVWSLAGVAVSAAARGDRARARGLVAEMEAMTSASGPSLHNAIFIAWGYVALGEPQQALEWLERYQPAANLHFQRHLLDGPLDPLRNEPRFQRLLR